MGSFLSEHGPKIGAATPFTYSGQWQRRSRRQAFEFATFARARIASIAQKAAHRMPNLGASPFTTREKPRKRSVCRRQIFNAAEEKRARSFPSDLHHRIEHAAQRAVG